MRSFLLPCVSLAILGLFACGSDNTDTGVSDSGATATSKHDASAAGSAHDAGSSSQKSDAGPTSGDGATGGSTGGTGHDAGSVADSGSGSHADASTGGDASSSTDAGTHASDSGAGGGAGGTALTGTLGSLGTVKPTVSSLWFQYSGETIVYLSSAPLTCAEIQMSRWLGKQPAESQVVEVIVKGNPKVGSATSVGLLGGEVNFAPGGKSSSYETTASSGSITFTKWEANGVAEAMISATYPMGSVMGTLHAEYCAGGQEY